MRDEPAQEVVPCALDVQTNVMLARKIDRGLNVRRLICLDHEQWEAICRTCATGTRHAGIIVIILPHIASRMICMPRRIYKPNRNLSACSRAIHSARLVTWSRWRSWLQQPPLHRRFQRRPCFRGGPASSARDIFTRRFSEAGIGAGGGERKKRQYNSKGVRETQHFEGRKRMTGNHRDVNSPGR